MKVAEHFLSIQGEGTHMGTLAVFLRLTGCNLLCGAPSLKKVKDKTNQKEIDAQQSKKATWTCDTIAKWLQGDEYNAVSLHKMFLSSGYLKAIKNGAHLVITGGEPLLYQNNEELLTFLDWVKTDCNAYIEVETNGTIMPTENFDRFVDWYNCSPKLENSGMSKTKRFKPDVLKFIKSKSYCFKFVIYDIGDVQNLKKEYLTLRFMKNDKNIFLMPACNNREEHDRISEAVSEICTSEKLKYSPRLQIVLWNKTVGV